MPPENVHSVGDRVVGLDCFPAPGHASHHVVYVAGDGTAYCGDAAGVRIQPHRLVLPPTPPPELDVEGWHRTIDELLRREPRELALVHFGVARDPVDHLESLRNRLDHWVELAGSGVSEQEFAERVRQEAAAHGEEALDEYERPMPFRQSYAGLKRYWQKQDR